ncbi:hypothetical protein COSHB9_02190 [Companilactobacillus alimentarius]
MNNYKKILDWIENCKRWSKAGSEQWGSNFGKADPWLIAYALTYNYTIVTMDGNGRATLPDANANSSREPKISAVACEFGVKTITIYELIEDLKIVL